MTFIGLVLIALGTGGIKPCVSAFGGDQFILPQQERYLSVYFSLFYFAINTGSLISTFLTPVLRNDVSCFGEKSCFSLAFFVPAVLMIVSIGEQFVIIRSYSLHSSWFLIFFYKTFTVIFAAGRWLYIVKKPEGNIVLKVVKCISVSEQYESIILYISIIITLIDNNIIFFFFITAFSTASSENSNRPKRGIIGWITPMTSTIEPSSKMSRRQLAF